MLGVLELAGKSNGFLRRREAGYLPDRADVHVGERVIRQYELRAGDEIDGEARPGGKGRGATLEKVTAIDGRPPADVRRRVELGEDVVLIVDSLTRLARAYNAVEKGTGRTLSGGLDAQSLERPKRFLGSARKIDAAQGGGSLTIIATALVDTGSKMDQVIFEEFKGTGNSELVLSRELAERRIYPAIDLVASATRREELLLSQEALAVTRLLRQRIAGMSAINAMNDLLTDMRRAKTNEELIQALAAS